MKKTFFFAAMLAIAASCTVYEIESVKGTTAPEITASYENNGTKTAITTDDEGVGTIWWKPADEINVFYGTVSTHYTSKNTENATTVAFGTTDIIGSTESAQESIWGLYPYDGNAVCDGESVTTTIPATQKAVAGTFDDDIFTSLAHSTSTTMTFYNVLGGIKFSLSRDDIQTITFKGNNNEDIAGKVSLSMDANGKPVAEITEGEKAITLTPKEGTTFASNTNYYIVLLPTVLSNGFTITFETETALGTFEYTAKSIEIKRSVFSKKENIDSYATFDESAPIIPDGSISGMFSVSSENKVYFAKGNLQATYNKVTHRYEWGFAENQYELVENTEENIYDLFGWSGHSHFNYGLSDQTASGYYDGYFLDWGVKIDNEGTWRTLNKSEWSYLLGNSTERDGKCKNMVNVNGVDGLVIAPDDFSGTIEDSYTASSWATAEQEGLVFLPTSSTKTGYKYYWAGTSTSQYDTSASAVYIGPSSFAVVTRLRRDASCVRLVSDVCEPSPIDLGLSVKWANCNVGARTPYGFGNYYAWGDTDGHGFEISSSGTDTDFNANEYKYSEGEYPNVSMTKYYDGDGLTTLDSGDDVAASSWGNGWRIPTKEEMEELVNTDNCSWTWYKAGNTEFNGVAGYKVQSIKAGYTDNYIFLPTAGWWQDNSYKGFYAEARYWTSTRSTDSNFRAYYSYFTSSSISVEDMGRIYGCTVRPVCP